MLDGQVAVNLNVSEPGMYFKLTNGELTKIGPVAVNSAGTAPNSAPAGATGNAIGEEWLDGRAAFSAPVHKIYDGSTWKPSSGFTVNDTTGVFSLTRELQTRTYVGTGTGQYGYLQLNAGPSTDEAAITGVAGMLRYDTTTDLVRFYNGTVWSNIGDPTGQDLDINDLYVRGNTILGNDCGTDTLTVESVATFLCNTTIGNGPSTSLTVGSLTDFQSGVNLTLQSDLRFHAGNSSSNYLGFQAPNTVTSTTVWTLPDGDGVTGQALVTNGAGQLSWAEGGGGASVTIADNAPSTPSQGDLWYDSLNGRMFVYYDEAQLNPPAGSDSQWVDASPQGSGVTDIVKIDDISTQFNGSQTAFTMEVSGQTQTAANEQQMIVDLGGVIQRPGIDYTVSAATITFTTAPQAGLTFNARLLGRAIAINTPGANTVGRVQLAADADIFFRDGNDIKQVQGANDVDLGSSDLTATNVNASNNVQTITLNGGPLAGLRNQLINGDFRVWQRGTGVGSWVAPIAGYYVADRWLMNSAGTGGNGTVSREDFAVDQTDVPGTPLHFLRWQITSAASGQAVGSSYIEQRMEDARTFAGQQITISFYVKGTGTLPGVYIVQSWPGGTGSTSVLLDSNLVLTGSWTKYTYTVDVPSIPNGTVLSGNSYFALTLHVPVNATYTLDLAQAQVEPGPVATPFEQRPIGMELELCQRYYFELPGNILAYRYTSVNNYLIQHPFPTTMRVAPTVTLPSPGGTTNWNTITSGSTAQEFSFTGTSPAENNATFVTNPRFDAEL